MIQQNLFISPADQHKGEPEFIQASKELKRFKKASTVESGLLTTGNASKVAMLSRQRLDQMHATHFAGYRFLGTKYIGVSELQDYLREQRLLKGGGLKKTG